MRWTEKDVVMRGMALYAGTVEYKVVIVKTNMRYASGDCEDDSEDEEGTFFDVWFETPGEPGTIKAGAPGYNSLQDAMAGSEKTAGVITWDK